jgi:hypothetical protein
VPPWHRPPPLRPWSWKQRRRCTRPRLARGARLALARSRAGTRVRTTRRRCCSRPGRQRRPASKRWHPVHRRARMQLPQLQVPLRQPRPRVQAQSHRAGNPDSRDKPLKLVFGNVTVWNRKCLTHLQRTSAHIGLFAELHLAGEALARPRDEDAPRLGWRAVIAPAATTARAGLSGGVGVFTRSYLQIQYLGTPTDHVGHDWATTAVRLKGCTLTIGSVYLSVGHQTGVFSEVNTQKLHQLKAHLATSTAPFILAGDWNCTPADLLSITWLDDIGAAIVLPEGVSFTCTGGSGNLLDYWVVSRSLLPAVLQAGRDTAATWKPHLGLELLLDRRCRRAHAHRIVAPPRWPSQPRRTPWESALESARRELVRVPPAHSAGQHEPLAVLRTVLDDWASEVTAMFSLWSRAAEVSVGCTGRRVRGQLPRLKWQPLLAKKPLQSWAACPREQFWQKLDALLTEYATLQPLTRPPGTTRSEHELHLRHLIARLARCVPEHSSTALPQLQCLADASQAFLQAHLLPARQAVEEQLHAASLEARRRARASFRDWAVSAVQRGASAARAWTRRHGTRPRLQDSMQAGGITVGNPSELMAARRAAWAGLWQQHDDQTALLLVLGALRRRAAREQLREAPLTLEQVATAVQRLPNKPTVWADGWKNSELKDLPTEAMESLTDLLNRIEQHGTVPAQARTAVVSLLPKPGNRGERPICVFPAITQLWGRLR